MCILAVDLRGGQRADTETKTNKTEAKAINNAKETVNNLLYFLELNKDGMNTLRYMWLKDQLTRTMYDLSSLKLQTVGA